MNKPGNKTAFIIQARMGSSRMPAKVLAPFAGGKSILEIITERLVHSVSGFPVCIATTVSASDDPVAQLAGRLNVHCFRGSEEDVLDRFLGAAGKLGVSRLIRVCADNPFLDMELAEELIRFADEEPADYCSFEVDENLPAIRSHWGVFTEIVQADALRKAAQLTAEPFFHEHVTNYIYGNPDVFRCRWKKAPPEIYGRTGIRFTIDTPADFDLAKRLWTLLEERGIPTNFRHALNLLAEFPSMQDEMQAQIRANSK